MNDAATRFAQHLIAMRQDVTMASACGSREVLQIQTHIKMAFSRHTSATEILDTHLIVGPPESERYFRTDMADIDSCMRMILAETRGTDPARWIQIDRSLRRVENMAARVDMVPMPYRPFKSPRMVSKPASRHITIKAPARTVISKVKIKGASLAGAWLDESFEMEE